MKEEDLSIQEQLSLSNKREGDLRHICQLLVMSNAEFFLDKVSIKFGCYTLSVLVDEKDTMKDVRDKLMWEIQSFYNRRNIEKDLRNILNL